jgi:hypothetical protein
MERDGGRSSAAASPRPSRRPGRAGCAVILLVVAGGLVALAMWLGRVDDSSRTPCERYARAVAWALDNCHSGFTRNLEHHTEVCERAVDPTPECLAHLRTLACREVEQLPTSAGTVCRKRP